ncbi:MAG: histidine kinase N-terminal 7TM domain-containing protein, partial [Halobacteriaceae archaeon]
MPSATTLSAVLAATIAISFAAALLAWRERPEPGANALVVLLGGQIWWSATVVFELQATTFAMKLFWSNIQWVGVVTIPVAWVLFALTYTGRDEYVRPQYIALLLVIPLITIVLAVTGEYHNLLYQGATLVKSGNIRLVKRVPGPWYWVVSGYTYLLGILGLLPIFQLVGSRAVLFRGQSIALIIGSLSPVIANALFLLGYIPIKGFDPTPISFAITGVAFLGALTRFRLLGTSPVPNRRARRLVFERMHGEAIVIDRNDYVVDLNESAENTFSLNRDIAIGKPAKDVIPKYDTIIDDDEHIEYITLEDEAGEFAYDVNITPVYDFHERLIGHVVTFHDISQYIRQQQRLEVLNRVFRHNLRTESQMVMGYIDQLKDIEDQEIADKVEEHALNIVEIGNKARSVLDIFETTDKETIEVQAIIEECRTRIEEEYPSVSVKIDTIPDDIYVHGVMDLVVWNIVENAAEHNDQTDPEIAINVNLVDERVLIQVADNGPGLPKYEQTVL